MQKKLPSNMNSSVQAQNLPKGGLWPKGGWPAAPNTHHANSPTGVLSDEINFARKI